jgi:hypothetical protein
MPKPSNKPRIDIEADAAAVVVGKDTLKQITKLADELVSLDAELAQLLSEQALAGARKQEIEQELLPALMMEAGMRKFEMTDGSVVNIKPFLRASIPTAAQIEKAADAIQRNMLIERRNAAFKWLIAHNAEPLIKMELTAEFGKGESKRAQAALQILTKAGVQAVIEQNVHNSTLVAFLKEQQEDGANIPAEVFSLFTGTKAELKRAK